MGDYTKLIVHCEARVSPAELQSKIKELCLVDSAYHCSGNVESVKPSPYEWDKEILYVNLIGQTKYGRGQDEFLTWLKPFVVQGSGSNDCWAMQFSEYQTEPICWFRNEKEVD